MERTNHLISLTVRYSCAVVFLCAILGFHAAANGAYTRIIIAQSAHPAIRSAAQLIAAQLKLPVDNAIGVVADPPAPAAGEILLVSAPASPTIARLLGTQANALQHDGYLVAFPNGGVIIYGARPRSLLYAAGDWRQWNDKSGPAILRNPSFAIRTAGFDSHRTVAENVADFGVNVLIQRSNSNAVSLKQALPEVYARLSPAEQQNLDAARDRQSKLARTFTQQCHDADVEMYTFLYGNNFQTWSPSLYDAALAAYPSIKGVSEPGSWEQGVMSPADPLTWKFVQAFIRDVMDTTQSDGLYVTFWDTYGINSKDPRSVAAGMDKFPNQLYACVKAYHDAVQPLGKKLVIRTWSSGVAHWLNDRYVHGVGNDDFGGAPTDLWSRVIKELPPDIMLQDKVYASDCQPDARFNPMIGHVQPHTEIAEYQLVGQTVGKYYFPTSEVDHTAWTMRKSHDSITDDGGVSTMGTEGTQPNYNLSDDILNSINLYAWRRLSWNINTDVSQIWLDWAVPIYGQKAAPHVVAALRLSEEAVYRSFSALGLGSDTNSNFAGSITRRETLLKYTNRYFLPEYAKFLEPTKENIQRVIDEKQEAARKIDQMLAEIELAKPDLTPAQYDELTTRTQWLKEFNIVARNLDESLWRFRYLRYLSENLTTDPDQMKYLAASFDAVTAHQARLFQFDPASRFSCYSAPLGQLPRSPSLGNPLPLMREMYEKSLALVEGIVGPDYLPKEVLRNTR